MQDRVAHPQVADAGGEEAVDMRDSLEPVIVPAKGGCGCGMLHEHENNNAAAVTIGSAQKHQGHTAMSINMTMT